MGTPSALNKKITVWAGGQVGKQIGAGECWDLANSALLQAGAQTSSDLGPTGADDDYVWGTVVDPKDALPGDVIQYRDWEMTTTTTTEITFSDDAGWWDAPSSTVGHPHHTSIITTNPGNGVLTVLEQNHLGNKEKVRNSTIRWKDAAPKITSSKKLMKRRDNGKTEIATITVKVEVTVSGTLTVYRPVAK
jgi:hypothetical protein